MTYRRVAPWQKVYATLATTFGLLSWSLLASASIVFGANSQALAQMRPIVIKDARVITMAGQPFDKASIKISGGKIAEVAPDIKTGFFTKTIDGKGKTVRSEEHTSELQSH